MKVSFYNVKRGIRYLKNYGFGEFIIRIKEKFEPDDIPYMDWYRKHCAKASELSKQKKDVTTWNLKPEILILISGDCENKKDLQCSIDSIERQTYDRWVVCLGNVSDDMLTKADYVACVDCGDILAPNALYEVARAICYPDKIRQSGVHWESFACMIAPDVIYTDEDKISVDLSEHSEPEFKPDYSIDLLRTNNYMKHFLIVSRELFQTIGGNISDVSVDSRYDYVFKCTEQAKRIVHIPKILYHCRNNEYENGHQANDVCAIDSHLHRLNICGRAEKTANCGYYRVRYEVKEKPLVSIIIPNKDERESLEKCIKSVSESTYDNLEVIIVENNSEQAETFEYYSEVVHHYGSRFKGGIKIVTWDSKGVFNYSAINNFGRRNACGEYLVLLNNDIEIISNDWIYEMLGVCMRDDVGIVGARLYYPDDTIQHAGIVIGIGGHARGVASSMFVGHERDRVGYLNKEASMLNYSAVTAACLMIKTTVFDEVGGFEEDLAVAFNDVDLCLKVRKAGYLIVYDPYAEAYHYESKSRGADDSEEKVRRFQSEIEYMRQKWDDIMTQGDPYYNPGLSRISNNYGLNGVD